MNKLIKIISISLISIFTLTGCAPEISNNITEYNSGDGNITINIEEGYKFVDIKIGVQFYTRTNGIKNAYVYTLTKKREASEAPETYKLDMVFNSGNHGFLPKHITIIEN